ncbi:MAG: putative lipid II flippase FtsW [Gammaproteobacteria bacterium]|nr:putative lipid II flippase FtsW [Gammaproteobacteria bacterium]MYD76320.1 putative lipid II flippase FtsW [Gammaproteobacteria bacterium]MYJ52742.1 putative lipid II flippase FtsW [Gammaproteobacteria bacterium]
MKLQISSMLRPGGSNGFSPRSGVELSQLLVVVALLMSFGLVMIFSATVMSSDQSLTPNYGKFLRHLAHIAISLLVMWAVSCVSIDRIERCSNYLMGLGIVLLVIVLVPGIGVEINGSRRWIDIGVAAFQPSELTKILTIVFFAAHLSRHQGRVHKPKVWMMPCAVVLAPVSLLLLLEPDLGMSMVIAVTVMVMIFVAGARLKDFAILLAASVAALAVLVLSVDYRRERLISYIDPFNDALGSGFQLVQSLIAIGRGEWLGVGLGNSIQKLFYLPHGENDFLIAIVGEELGSVGIIVVLALYAVLMWRIFRLSRSSWAHADMFSSLLALGIGIQISFQAIVHVGVNVGLFPTKGLTLPFMSYGGSSMLSSMIGVGLLLAIERDLRHRFRNIEEKPE